MAVQIVDLRCSGCNSGVTPSASFCDYCGNPVVVTSFNSVWDKSVQDVSKLARALDKNNATNQGDDLSNLVKFTLASCYLKMKLYDKALPKFEDAMDENPDNPDAFFYSAICLLKGKKAFVTPMGDVKKAIEYANAALMIENRGVFNYFLAYIKYDFYTRKGLMISPSYQDELQQALSNNLSVVDADMLFGVLGVDMPVQLQISNIP